MNDLFIIANCVVTTVYLLLCFVTDLKERMIYSFPALALSVSWWIVAIVSADKSPEIYGIVIVHILLYFLLKVVRIWADGDNDLFLLFTAVFAAVHPDGGTPHTVWRHGADFQSRFVAALPGRSKAPFSY